MKTINLRDANQQFSRLVREIEETGEPVLVLRNGKPAIKLMPAEERNVLKKLTPEQEAALARIRDPNNHFKTSRPDWKISREALWDEIVSRHGVVRSLDERARKKRP